MEVLSGLVTNLVMCSPVLEQATFLAVKLEFGNILIINPEFTLIAISRSRSSCSFLLRSMRLDARLGCNISIRRLSSRSFSANILTISGKKLSERVSNSSRSVFAFELLYFSVNFSQSWSVRQATDQHDLGVMNEVIESSSSSAEEMEWWRLFFFFLFFSFFFLFFSLSFLFLSAVGFGVSLYKLQ